MDQMHSIDLREPSAKRFCADSNRHDHDKSPMTSHFPHDSSPYQQDIMYGTSTNVLAVREYHNLKKEHESLKMQFQSLQSHLDHVKTTLNGEIERVRSENYNMEIKVAHIKRELCEKGISLSDSDSVGGVSGDKAANSTGNIANRLAALEKELRDVKSELKKIPLRPPQAVLDYLVAIVNHYSSEHSANIRNQAGFAAGSQQNESQQPKTPYTTVQNMLNFDTSATSTSATPTPGTGNSLADKNIRRAVNNQNVIVAQPQDGSKSTSPRDSKIGLPFPLLLPSIEVVDGNKATSAYTQATNSMNDSMVWSEGEAITPTIPAPEESPYTQKVQLLPKYNIWVSRTKLTNLLQEATSQPTENAPLFVLRRLIPLVFSLEEMATSRGQGITMKTRGKDDMHSSKNPLDPVKASACKDFMRMFCTQNELTEPTNVAINSQFTHCVNYARNKLKRMSVRSMNASVNSQSENSSENQAVATETSQKTAAHFQEQANLSTQVRKHEHAILDSNQETGHFQEQA